MPHLERVFVAELRELVRSNGHVGNGRELLEATRPRARISSPMRSQTGRSARRSPRRGAAPSVGGRPPSSTSPRPAPRTRTGPRTGSTACRTRSGSPSRRARDRTRVNPIASSAATDERGRIDAPAHADEHERRQEDGDPQDEHEPGDEEPVLHGLPDDDVEVPQAVPEDRDQVRGGHAEDDVNAVRPNKSKKIGRVLIVGRSSSRSRNDHEARRTCSASDAEERSQRICCRSSPVASLNRGDRDDRGERRRQGRPACRRATTSPARWGGEPVPPTGFRETIPASRPSLNGPAVSRSPRTRRASLRRARRRSIPIGGTPAPVGVDQEQQRHRGESDRRANSPTVAQCRE